MVWWFAIETFVDIETYSWDMFEKAFQDKFIPNTTSYKEILGVEAKICDVVKYASKFDNLYPLLVATLEDMVERFIDSLDYHIYDC